MEFSINDVGYGVFLEDQQGEVMSTSEHLVPLKPAMFKAFECPKCGREEISVHGSVFCGIHILGQYKCENCDLEFYRDLPVGFAVDHPLAISKEGEVFGVNKSWEWISEPLINGFNKKNDTPVEIEKRVFRKEENVIFLNTLDYLYGHVLLKLYNAIYYIEEHRDKGLILLLPKMFSWLIPEGVAEVWLVDQRLGQAQGWHTAINDWVQEQLSAYRSVELGKGYAHPEFADLDIEAFSGVRPFPMEEFNLRDPHITFVARQDRIWFKNRASHFMYRLVRKFGMKHSLGKWWLRKQDGLMKRTMDRITEYLPEAQFTVVGLGKPGNFMNAVSDLRTEKMSDEIERSWCEAYGKSQVVIGVHGSNMLLPTAHAAGCVEILPDDRFGNIVQDISVRYNDRMQLFLYRFVDEYASPRTVAKHVKSMFHDFEVYFKDNRTNTFKRSDQV